MSNQGESNMAEFDIQFTDADKAEYNTMNLVDFIAEALRQVRDGIKSTSDISPTHQSACDVEFDLSVVATTDLIKVVAGGTSGLSRIKFSVPIKFPAQEP